MVPRENKNKAYAKFGGTNKEYYGIFRSGQLHSVFSHVFRKFLLSIAKVFFSGGIFIEEFLQNGPFNR